MKFSIIIPHYQGTISSNALFRCLDSIRAQTYIDYEILLYHDGPLHFPIPNLPVPIECTDVRYNNFGHTQRGLGINKAKGEYIIHLNSDNILYPNALEEIYYESKRPSELLIPDIQPVDNNDIIIFAILLRGVRRFFGGIIQVKDRPEYSYILTGDPPYSKEIDAMQLVMKRECWIAEGGWSDTSLEGDSNMYEKFCRKYGYRGIPKILGEHF